jgi:hypothetical protein
MQKATQQLIIHAVIFLDIWASETELAWGIECISLLIMIYFKYRLEHS